MKEKLQIDTELFFQHNGVDVSKYDDVFLTKSVQHRIKDAHCENSEAYLNLLEQNKPELDEFVDSLHVCYSEFFRNPITFALLEKIILPSLASKMMDSNHKELKIWSVACAGGQEVYSLAMLLHEFISSTKKEFNFRIFATDISALQIKEAKQGHYMASALNMLNMNRLNKWFTNQGDIYAVKPELKENIDFSVFDLFDNQFSCPPTSIFGNFDIVICANLLFYYKPEFRKKILEKVANSITTDGLLITGETEREILINHNFQEVFPHSAIFKKADNK